MSTEATWTKIANIRSRNGKEVIYAAWSTGQIFQVTAGDPPTSLAGYGNLDALLKLKNILPRQVDPVNVESAPEGPRF